MGHQDGEISLLKYNIDPLNLENVTRVKLDGPISSVFLFEIETEVIDLLVVSAVGYCILYRDILQENMGRKIIIRPPCSDALTCASASDIDFDGQKEILIGSFSKELFCFKLVDNSIILLWKMEFMHPLQSITEIDINKDGISEIIVLSMYGIIILVPNHTLACKKFQAVKEYLNKS